MLAIYLFLLLVGASRPIIENRLKITTVELNNVLFKLDLSMAFDSIYVVSSRRQRAHQGGNLRIVRFDNRGPVTLGQFLARNQFNFLLSPTSMNVMGMLLIFPPIYVPVPYTGERGRNNII